MTHSKVFQGRLMLKVKKARDTVAFHLLYIHDILGVIEKRNVGTWGSI